MQHLLLKVSKDFLNFTIAPILGIFLPSFLSPLQKSFLVCDTYPLIFRPFQPQFLIDQLISGGTAIRYSREYLFLIENINMGDYGFVLPAQKIPHVPHDSVKRFERLGYGGFGEVFRAELPDGTPVAMKVVDEQMSIEEDFKIEFRMLRKLRHTNIVQCVGVDLE